MERSPSIMGVMVGSMVYVGAHFVGQRQHSRIVLQVLAHQHVGDDHLYPALASKRIRRHCPLQRPRQLGNGVMHLRRGASRC